MSAAAPSTGAGRDWPQLMRDAQRTGYSPEEISAPAGFEVGWQVNFLNFDPPERVYRTVQVIGIDNKLFVPTQEGSLYALDPADGKTLWRFQSGEGVMHTAGAQGGRVFFATIEGGVFAVDAATGEQVWTWHNGLDTGFSSAVLLAEGKVFVGGRGGDFHALDQGTGSEIWSRHIKAPFYQTAAYSEGRVYIAAEDMRCYCWSAGDGKPLWKSRKLSGESFRDYYPLVYRGLVILDAQPNWCIQWFNQEFHPFQWPVQKDWLDQHGEALANGAVPDAAMRDMLDAQERQIAAIKENPDRQLRFALDEKTGQETFILPYWNWAMCGPQPPPAVDRDGMLVMPVVLNGGRWGRMNPDTWRIIDILHDTSGRPGMGSTNIDESQVVSAAGSLIFSVHWYENMDVGHAAYFDLTARKWDRFPHGLTGCLGRHGAQCGTNPASVAFGAVYHQAFSLVHNWVPKKH